MNEHYEPGSPLSTYSEDEDLNQKDSYINLISFSQPHALASHKSGRQTGRSAQTDPLMPRTEVAFQPVPVASSAHLVNQQCALVPKGTPLIVQWPV